MAELKSLIVNGVTRLNNTSYATDLYANKFIKNGSSDNYVLLGAGSHKLISDFANAVHSHSEYVTLATAQTISGQKTFSLPILHPATGTWINAMNNGSVINFPNANYDSLVHWKTKSGHISISSHASAGDSLTFGYMTDAVVSAGTNSLSTSIVFDMPNARVTANGYIKSGSSDSYVLLGGGGHKLITDFATYNHTHTELPNALRLSNNSGGDIHLELWRGSNASWKLLDTSGNLYFMSNYTSSAGSYFSVMQLDYNTGNVSVNKGLLNVASTVTSTGFKKNGSSDSYVLLGGGGHKLITDFATNHTHTWDSITEKPNLILVNSGTYRAYSNAAAPALADNTAGLSQWAFGEARNTGRAYFGILKPAASTTGISAHGIITVFGAGDTHLGFAGDYSGANVHVFGGNADKIVWRKQLSFSDHGHSYYWANVAVSTSSNSGTSPTFNTAYASNWFRTTGNTGWYSESYGGGIYMTDSTWVRIYGSKQFYVNNSATSAIYSVGGIKTDNHFYGSSSGGSWLDGQRYENALINLATINDSNAYYPVIRWTNSNQGRWYSIGTLGSDYYFVSSVTSRTANEKDATFRINMNTANIYSAGYHHTGMDSNNYLLLAGGSYKAITDFALSGHNHNDDYVKKRNDYRFNQYNSGNWIKIGTFTINAGTLYPAISFRWIPSECARDIFADFAITIRDSGILFYGAFHGTGTRIMRCTGNGTTYNIWVYTATKASYDPYGCIQHMYSYAVNSYNYGNLAFQDTTPSETYNADVTIGGVVDWSRVLNKPLYWANIGLQTTSNTGTSPTFSTAYTSNWFRSTGQTGWYNETYGGGIYMIDSTYVRVSHSKKLMSLGFCHSSANSDSYVLLAGGGYTALAVFGAKSGVTQSWARGAYTSANQYFGNGNIVTIDPKGTGCISANDTILSLGDTNIRNTQLLFAYDRDGIYYRRITDGAVYGDWKLLSFSDHTHGNYVTLDTTQTITGAKTFNSKFVINSSNVIGGSSIAEIGCSGDALIWGLEIHNRTNVSTITNGVGLKLGLAETTGKWSGVACVSESTYANTSGIAIYTSASEKVRITNAGRLGVGITSPSYTIHAVGDIYSSAYIRANSGFIKTNSSDSYVLLGGGGHKLLTDFSLTSHSHTQYVLKTGDTMTGTLTMNVSGTSTSTNDILFIRNTGYDSNGSSIGVYSGISMGQRTDGGRAGIYAVAEANWSNNTGLALFTGITSSYTEKVRINYSGNVGIGTTSPGYKLHVAGDIYSSSYVRGNSGFVKGGSSNDYMLLGGGGHKALNYFFQRFDISGNKPNLDSFGDSNNNDGLYYINFSGALEYGIPFNYGAVLNLSNNAYSGQLAFSNGGAFYYRSRWWSGNGAGWTAWKQIAFTTDINNHTHSTYVLKTGDTMSGQLKSTYNGGSFYTTVGYGSWAYMRLDSSTVRWDIGTNSSTGILAGSLEFRYGGNNIGAYVTSSGQLGVTAASGTAPFRVNSTTAVSNLNADLLDGYHATGLFTTFAANGNATSITVGGTNRQLTIPYATLAGKLTNTGVTDVANAKDDTGVKWFAQLNSYPTAGTSGYAANNAGFPVANNANGILWLGTHPGNYGGQLGVSSNGNLYYRCISNNNFPTTANGGSWNKLAFLSEIVKNANDSRFTQYNKGSWTKIGTFTVPNGSYGAVIAFRWIPSECSREVFADFAITLRQSAVIFYGVFHGTSTRTMRCTGNGTTYNIWVYGTKTSWDPYGCIQHMYSYDVTSYSYGSLAYQDTTPSETYNADVTVGGVVYMSNNVNFSTSGTVSGFSGGARNFVICSTLPATKSANTVYFVV